jgi:hypothetical protein
MNMWLFPWMHHHAHVIPWVFEIPLKVWRW